MHRYAAILALFLSAPAWSKGAPVPAGTQAVPPAPAAAAAASERVPGYVPDARPIGFTSVAEAGAYLAAPCASAAAKKRGCTSKVMREQPHMVMVGDGCDVSYWTQLGADLGFGVAVVRDRFFWSRAAHIRTSYLCEGSSEECARLLEYLKARPDQPQSGPPPPPPPPDGGVCVDR